MFYFLCANVVVFLSHLTCYLDVDRCDPGTCRSIRASSPLHTCSAGGRRPRRREARGAVYTYSLILRGFISKYRLAIRSRLASQTIVTRTQNAKKRGAGPKTVPPPRGSGLKLQLYSYSYSTHCLSAATAFCAASSRSSAERMARPEFLMISLP